MILSPKNTRAHGVKRGTFTRSPPAQVAQDEFLFHFILLQFTYSILHGNAHEVLERTLRVTPLMDPLADGVDGSQGTEQSALGNYSGTVTAARGEDAMGQHHRPD